MALRRLLDCRVTVMGLGLVFIVGIGQGQRVLLWLRMLLCAFSDRHPCFLRAKPRPHFVAIITRQCHTLESVA